MNKYHSWAFLLSTLTLSAPVLAFNPIVTSVIFTCPCVESITKAGDHLEATGTELILNNNNAITFKSADYIFNALESYAHYTIASISYESVYGEVACSYVSSISTESPLLLSYPITNGYGGAVQAKSNTSIMIGFPLGIKAS